MCFLRCLGAIYFQAGNQCIVHPSDNTQHALLVQHDVWITICFRYVQIQVVLCNCLTSITLAGFAPLALSKASTFSEGALNQGAMYLNVKTLLSQTRAI